MAENTWLVVRSPKIHVTSADEWNDGLSKLPDEVLLTVMSSLPMKEAARTNILSHKWRELWPYFSGVFNFECSQSDTALFKKHASDFVSWVNRIVEEHRGPAIEGFKSCPSLEKLCISCSMCLTSITDWGLALALKHLEVIYCDELVSIDISAPKLVTFKYTGQRMSYMFETLPCFRRCHLV